MHAGVYRVICGQAKAFAAYREGGSVVPTDPIEGHECLPHDGRPGRIGETLHHTFVVVKAVLDRLPVLRENVMG